MKNEICEHFLYDFWLDPTAAESARRIQETIYRDSVKERTVPNGVHNFPSVDENFTEDDARGLGFDNATV